MIVKYQHRLYTLLYFVVYTLDLDLSHLSPETCHTTANERTGTIMIGPADHVDLV